MRFVADLHIHSHYSRATSKASNIRSLAAWAQIKGVHVLGCGDFTHPEWFAELEECLVEAETGFFRLRSGLTPDTAVPLVPDLSPAHIPVRFVLSAEVSCIYKRGGQVRKIHCIIIVPDLESARRINTVLAQIGNLQADGRPILGLDARDLLEIVLEQAPEGFLVPAHIWTPWFSLFGSKSGFDHIEDCFGDLTPHIFALETGLSSDPAMNRLISSLDRFTLISNSDCHSPGKLCREANLFHTDFNYFGLRQAIRYPQDEKGNQRFLATLEFYPEEGKYHHDGHRKCAFSCSPEQSRTFNNICPVCGRPVTVGVLSRVMELADRQSPVYPQASPAVITAVPLAEILSEILSVGPLTKTVARNYGQIINEFGSEMNVLFETPIEDLKHSSVSGLANAIERMRTGQVEKIPGFDGEFGRIRVCSKE
ncbi:MAG: DNA helicase UvrD [Desulfobulbaceae bacterium]|uniref:DNA helicase UvrD n=1 Tax=Candidatus Desulfatifera sulfidica TaxID=2841691 RepID=A0A8J6TEC2_9BACT|nr:DNA helicase UvrD [Candidatus Desulfatifera sulfidica]